MLQSECQCVKKKTCSEVVHKKAVYREMSSEATAVMVNFVQVRKRLELSFTCVTGGTGKDVTFVFCSSLTDSLQMSKYQNKVCHDFVSDRETGDL